MTDTVVAEGQVKFRDGKKWKTRWVVLRKPSPVADCLFLVAYKKDKKKKSKKGIGQKDSLTLEGVCGVEPAPGFDGVSYSLSILCLSHTLVLGFSSREALQAWDARIRFHLGEVHRFSVNVEPGSKLEAGPASLHLCNSVLVLSRGLPPLVTGHWKLSSLRRYGAVPNGFVFEGGSRCGYWSGVFYLSSSDGEQISFLVDCIVRGVSVNRSSQRLHPANPADANPVSEEERVLQETSDLEKRLSRLSSCSLASSTASTFSCSTSIAGDDHSSISSSSSSQSDTSYGPRLPFWPESSSRLRSSTDTASSCSTLKPLTVSDDRLYAAAAGNPRRLHDSGRQSSLDSGIGIAASSQSSGSYTGSLDATVTQGQGFGSVPSLASSQTLAEPPHSPPPPPPIEAAHAPNASSFRCVSPAQRPEHRAPSVFQLRYDTPRSLLQSALLRDTPTPNPSEDRPNAEGYWWSGGPPKVIVQNSATWGSDGHETPRARSVPASLFNGRKQCGHAADNYITSEQWQTVGSTTTKKVEKWASARTTATSKPDEQNYGALGSMLARLKMSLPSSAPPAPSALPARPATACGVFGPERVAAPCGLDPSLYLHNSVHYVNLPFSSMLLNKDRPATGSTLTVPPPAEGSTGAAAMRGDRPWGRHGTPHHAPH